MGGIQHPVTRPSVRFAMVKSVAQQDLLARSLPAALTDDSSELSGEMRELLCEMNQWRLVAADLDIMFSSGCSEIRTGSSNPLPSASESLSRDSKGPDGSNLPPSATQSGMLPYIMEKR
jgi:hypothetical protein